MMLVGYAFWTRSRDAGPSSFEVFASAGLVLLYAVLIVVALAKGVYFVFKRDGLATWQYVWATCIGIFFWYLFGIFAQPEVSSGPGPHENIAKIYEQRRAEEFDPSTARVVNTSPRLVDLEQQCNPRSWCNCWIALDPLHKSDIDRELGRGFHRPQATFPSDRGEPVTLFPADVSNAGFGLVEVRRIDSIAYSVLSCVP
jgi:hypothetical protein